MSSRAGAIVPAAPAATGSLSIDSFTRDAEVFVGQFVGKTRILQPLRLAIGRHTVRVSRLGYGDFVDRVTIRKNAKTSLLADLIPVAGILTVTSQPEGADVVIDDKYLGYTPFRGAVTPGTRILTIHLPDYVLQRSQVNLSAGEETKIDTQLIIQGDLSRHTQTPWYTNHWFWIGAASAVVAGIVVTAVALSDDEASGPEDAPLVIPTVR